MNQETLKKIQFWATIFLMLLAIAIVIYLGNPYRNP